MIEPEITITRKLRRAEFEGYAETRQPILDSGRLGGAYVDVSFTTVHLEDFTEFIETVAAAFALAERWNEDKGKLAKEVLEA